jgi:hypothetical protein
LGRQFGAGNTSSLKIATVSELRFYVGVTFTIEIVDFYKIEIILISTEFLVCNERKIPLYETLSFVTSM